jgi:murein DD-endopeptidase MepM/ murein hydrolase activator NlpD
VLVHRNINSKRKYAVIAGLAVFFAFVVFNGGIAGRAEEILPAPTNPTDAAEVADINQSLQEKRQAISALDEQSETLEKNLAEREKQAQTLERDLGILTDNISQNELSIQRTKLEAERVSLELNLLEKTIAQKNAQAQEQRSQLADLLRRWNRQTAQTQLEMTLVYNSFSDFLSRVKETEGVQRSVQDSHDELIALKTQLEQEQATQKTKHDELVQYQSQLASQQTALQQQQNYKDSLLSDTLSAQEKYQALLSNLRAEADRVNAEISTLEQRVREKLAGAGETLAPTNPGILLWPVQPARGVSAGFRDPFYPFRCTKNTGNNCIGEHSGIDIPVPQGTAVRAAADGYVAIARNLDWVRDANGKILRSAYNYVSILHGQTLSTVYGHLSVVSVTEDQFVKRGQVIGLSGALPGTAGAGPWTTGAHLHFEVRENGIPADPLFFLSK